MNVIDDHLDILQNIEFTTIAFWRQNPDLKDAHVLVVYEKLYSNYDRRRQKLMILPFAFQSEMTIGLFKEVEAICETRIVGSPTEAPDGFNVPPATMARCLKRLCESVRMWTKINGVRGYLKFVGEGETE
jgi:hypothetical protein